MIIFNKKWTIHFFHEKIKEKGRKWQNMEVEDLTIMEVRFKKLREKNNLTQEELAHKLNVSRSLIALWERGYANISLKQITKLSYVYQVPIDYLLGIIDTINPKIKYNYIDNINLINIGKRLREIRKKEECTQEKFAAKIDTKRSSISYYEIGKMTISTADLKQICETFGISADYIIGTTNTYIVRKKVSKKKIKEIKEALNV